MATCAGWPVPHLPLQCILNIWQIETRSSSWEATLHIMGASSVLASIVRYLLSCQTFHSIALLLPRQSGHPAQGSCWQRSTALNQL